MFQTIIASQLVFILGIVNVLLAALLFFSCRCVNQFTFGTKLMKLSWFQCFFKFHCHIWWIFLVSIITHAVLAIGFFSIPF
jgi:hypothetical protein